MKRIIFILILFSNLYSRNIEVKNKEKNIETYLVQNIDINEVITSLNGLYNVEVKKVGNELVLIGKKEDIKNLKNLLLKIDRKKRQILIKANIIETSSNLFDRLGFNWKLNEKKVDISLSNIFNLGGNFLGVDIDALKESGDIKIMSTPYIHVIDGKEGELKITEELSLSNGKENKPYFYEAGLIFIVKPKIILKGYKEYIDIDIYSEMSNFKSNGKSKLKNIIKTNFLVRNNSSIFVGGINQESNKKSLSKTPFLGEIPIFGTFFRKKNNIKEKRDLYIEIEVSIVE